MNIIGLVIHCMSHLHGLRILLIVFIFLRSASGEFPRFFFFSLGRRAERVGITVGVYWGMMYNACMYIITCTEIYAESNTTHGMFSGS